MIHRAIALIACVLMLSIVSSSVQASGGHDHGHDHAEQAHDPEKGPHRGRLLREGDFALEVSIFEDGIPPQYRLYAYEDDAPIDPKSFSASIEIERPFSAKEQFLFAPQHDYLVADRVVGEPHSFTVHVHASYKEHSFSWSYDSFEGRTTLSDEALQVAAVGIDTVQSAQIHTMTEIYGRILPNEDKVAHVYPRFPGIIKEIRKKLGDTVAKGDVLAVIESNQSLQVYEIRSQLAGAIVKRHATVGEFSREDKELFIVADLSEVWADFQVYQDDQAAIEVGQAISIDVDSQQEPLQATVSYVSPLTDTVTQSKMIRAVIANTDALLRPGLFISGHVSSKVTTVPRAVKREAIQTFRDWHVVFLTDGHTFQAMPVELGKQDNAFVEIVSGIELGDRYVSTNSFIIKSDIEKHGATHDH